MPDLTLYSAEVCPFAQRSLILLIEKGVEYDHVEIDLRNKPDDFETISPYSKVPVLLDGETRVYESAIINEYLDEILPEPPFMPGDPGQRARARIWIDFDNTRFVPAFYKVLLADDAPRRRELAETIADALKFMEREALARRGGGPYWLGSDISLADVSIYPHMERLGVLEAYRDIALPDECGALRDWLAGMAERPSVAGTAHGRDYQVSSYARYADGTADGTTARDMRM